jgi:preprotein translocase subunit SecD
VPRAERVEVRVAVVVQLRRVDMRMGVFVRPITVFARAGVVASMGVGVDMRIVVYDLMRR